MTVVSVAVFIKGMEPTVNTIEGSESLLAVRLDRHVTLYGTRPELLAVLDAIVVQVAGSPERDLSAENEALRHDLLLARSERDALARTDAKRPLRWVAP